MAAWSAAGCGPRTSRACRRCARPLASVRARTTPPFPPCAKRGEVAPSHGAGGVMGNNDAAAYDPSVADYRATSPCEWGGKVFVVLCVLLAGCIQSDPPYLPVTLQPPYST